MAFLRRGLVTNKGAVPSVHTRTQAIHAANILPILSKTAANDEDDCQPVLHIRKVAKILRMANTTGEYHLVQLECGHTTTSKSTFQGYCKTCKVSHT
jgi:hypothetical protein